MKFSPAIILASLPYLVHGKPVAVAGADAVPIADAAPLPQYEALPISLEKRADNVCRVTTTVNCRSGPGTSYGVVRTIGPNDRFGVRCINGSWDWIPGWGCWVSATYTRSADSHSTCESGLHGC